MPNKESQLKKLLKAEDYTRLQSILPHQPTSVEITLALALWNEHCSYRSSRIHLKKFNFSTSKKVAAIGENAGIIDLGQGERVAFKMESHNHPSYIIPYHGAATGVGGILRDVFAMNARPICLADYLCFGEPQTNSSRLNKDKINNSQADNSNNFRVDGVVRGIGGYGNCVGVPTVNGHTEFDESYNGNILVNAMALGFLGSQTKEMSSGAKGVGNYVVYVGAATGRDGVLGASMASASFEKEEAAKPTVQIGDPFFGKQLMEACLLAMDKGLVVACQDMGAAGLTSSSFEMAEKGNTGLSLHLDKVPLRDKNMQPEDILLSESQERMLFICEPSCYKELKNIFNSHQLEIEILGQVLDSKKIELYWHGQQLLKVDPNLFTSQAPIEHRPYKFPEPSPRALPKQFTPSEKELKNILLKILKSPNGRNRKFIYEQYDQRVGANTIKDCSYPVSVIRLPESGRELGIALGCRTSLMKVDVEQGAKDSIFYPALQLAARGFTPLAVTDCLNFGNPEKENIMGEFVLSVETIAKACQTLDTPVISGNVSFYNESQGINIVPTPSIAMVGIKENDKALPSHFFKEENEQVYLLSSHQFWLQGSAKMFLEKDQKSDKVYGALQDPLVKLFIDSLKETADCVNLSSLQVVGKFGLLYWLARMALETGMGFTLNKNFSLPLLQERLYEVIVSVSPEQEQTFKDQIQKLHVDCQMLGVTKNNSTLKFKEHEWAVKDLQQAYNCTWEDICL